MLLPSILLCAGCSHVYFKSREPQPSIILSLLTVAVVSGIAGCIVTDPVSSVLCRVSAWIVAYFVILTLFIIGYRLSPQHPLSRFPGPQLAHISKLWNVYLLVFRGGRTRTYQELHDKYGPWVRIGPNELSINLKEAIRPIYLSLSKANAYHGIPATADTLLTIIDKKQHNERKKAWLRSLSGKEIMHYTPAIMTRINQFITALTTMSKQNLPAVDIGKWTSFFLMDVTGDISFSGGFEMIKAGRDDMELMKNLDAGAVVVGVLTQIPWLRGIIDLVPQPGPIAKFFKFAMDKVLETQDPESASAQDYNILKGILSNSPGLKNDEAAADASLLIAASVETTSQAFITLIRHLYAQPTVLQTLRAEIATLSPNESADLERLPYLNACVNEALRILPPFPTGPPRTTGKDGATILDQYVPPNTTIHVPTWSVHHDAAYFENPHVFVPERWLPLSGITPHSPDAFIPFTVGFASCPGRYLALLNLRMLTMDFVTNFDATFAVDLDEFDSSYQDFGLWRHKPLLMNIRPIGSL